MLWSHSKLDAIGVLPTAIVQNLNVERNLVEHDYAIPERKRVAEALDVAQLLQLAIERLLENGPVEAVVGWKDPPRQAVLRLERQQGQIQLLGLKAKGHYRRIQGINCFSGEFRTGFNSTLAPGILVSKRPWRTIDLQRTNIAEWKSTLVELVRTQRDSGLIAGGLSHGVVTTTLSFPLEDAFDLSAMADRAMHERLTSEHAAE